MNRTCLLALLWLIAVACSNCVSAQPSDPADQWAQWRGPLATGEAPHADPPVSWSETENVAWKTELPGKGHSTPIVWGDTVIVTAAEPFGEKLEPRYSGAPGAHDNVPVSQHHRFLVIAVNRKDGSVLWQKQVHEALPHEGAHYTGSLASASPVTDGERIYAYFGSWGLYCLDFEGNVLWEKSLGTMNTRHGHGEGASPVLHDGKLVINWDHEGRSFVAVFDSATGNELWRVPRAEVTSWSSPIIVPFPPLPKGGQGGSADEATDNSSQAQVIVAGTNRVRGYDLADGSVIWECGGLSENVVATPVAADGMVIVGSSYEKRAMFGIKLEGAEGDITDTDQVVWFTNQRTPYVPSPLLYRGSVYFLRHYQGVLSRLDAATGEERLGPFRLHGLTNIYASPVAADGRIYVTDRDGVTIVFSHVDDESEEVPRMLSANPLDDEINASLALAGRQVFIRGQRFLYCIEDE